MSGDFGLALRLLGYTACQHYGFRAKLHGGMTAIGLIFWDGLILFLLG